MKSFREKTHGYACHDRVCLGEGFSSHGEKMFVSLNPVALEAGELCLQGDTDKVTNLVTRGRNKKKHPKPMMGLISHAEGREISQNSYKKMERAPCT